MDARNRLVIPWSGSKSSPVMAVVVLVVALVAAVLFVSLMLSTRTTGSTQVGAAAVTRQQQAPDAVERNDVYSAALAARAHESADGGDRNAQLTYGQMLAMFNDQSPDSQERNIALSGR